MMLVSSKQKLKREDVANVRDVRRKIVESVNIVWTNLNLVVLGQYVKNVDLKNALK